MIEINMILVVGLALTLGFFLGKLTNVLRLTSIVGYIIAGIILGPVTHIVIWDTKMAEIIANFTLSLVAFIIGVGFTRDFIKQHGKMSIGIAVIQSIITFLAIFVIVFIFTKNLTISLILGAIGPATAPAGTYAALHELRAKGPLSKMTTAVVGIDDGVTIVFFVIIMAIAKTSLGGTLSLGTVVAEPLIEIFGAVGIGLGMGAALGYICKRLRNDEEIFLIALAFIFLSAGIAAIVHASSILTCMFVGIAFVNIVPRFTRIAHGKIEEMMPPIFLIFFFVAGMELQLTNILAVGLLGGVYIFARTIGKVGGGALGGKVMKAEETVQKYLGFALLSQAGVAIGLAILVIHFLADVEGGPVLGTLALTIITASTVFFEIIGPIGVRFAVMRAGETPIKH